MSKSILILSTPMPYSKIGSWTTMYNYYFHDTKQQFDYIICPKPDVDPFSTVEYSFIKPVSFFSKLKVKFKIEHRLQNYFSALDKILNSNEKYIIQIVDNSGLVVPLDLHIRSKYKRENFYIQYYYQGFSPLFSNPSTKAFFNGIDEMIFLTKLSYKAYLTYYDEFVCKASILYNATDSKQFFKLDSKIKQSEKDLMGFKSKMIFIWCSQDRPKKGLDFILQVWKEIFEKYGNEVELLIIGAKREMEYPGVNFIGRVPNNELAKYYQISDFYLFPSLWKEGFGIVLAEALKSGCYCIASNQGGIPEVLQFGKIGKIVNNPNFSNEWVVAIIEAIEIYRQHDYNSPYTEYIDANLYDMDNWSNEMNILINHAKLSI
jgi:glycosyltransferase involved in cell wall biosynthesis